MLYEGHGRVKVNAFLLRLGEIDFTDRNCFIINMEL